ncbi:hypothetical protein V6N12_011574 [Hibiscus sabdariffa]|uniref:Uncharacterized protein n=1 Tax=Hibiscus sabdariffa TaxID=183260 RepID=A0ABR2AZ15_9ROSI
MPTTTTVSKFTCSNNRMRNGWLFRAQLSNENDPLLQSAIDSASLQPLFVDPYAGCFVPPHTRMDLENPLKHYCIATKFIDDKLLRTVSHLDGLKQVLGLRVPRNCLYLHIPLESTDIQQTLRTKGFNGNRPSIWAIQGLPVMTLARFEEILLTVSGMAMKGSIFLGELPAWLAETEFGSKSSTEEWMDNLFMSNGFKASMISYNDVAKSLGKVVKPGEHENILFVSEQLQLSEDQMEARRAEIQNVEEDGDEHSV